MKIRVVMVILCLANVLVAESPIAFLDLKLGESIESFLAKRPNATTFNFGFEEAPQKTIRSGVLSEDFDSGMFDFALYGIDDGKVMSISCSYNPDGADKDAAWAEVIRITRELGDPSMIIIHEEGEACLLVWRSESDVRWITISDSIDAVPFRFEYHTFDKNYISKLKIPGSEKYEIDPKSTNDVARLSKFKEEFKRRTSGGSGDK